MGTEETPPLLPNLARSRAASPLRSPGLLWLLPLSQKSSCSKPHRRVGPAQPGVRLAWCLGCALSLMSASENLRKTAALFPTSFIQDFSIPSNSSTPIAHFPPPSELLSACFLLSRHISLLPAAGLWLPWSHPAPTALLPNADPLVCSLLGCSSDLHV